MVLILPQPFRDIVEELVLPKTLMDTKCDRNTRADASAIGACKTASLQRAQRDSGTSNQRFLCIEQFCGTWVGAKTKHLAKKAAEAR